MPERFKGKVAIVAGAGRGNGKAFALAFARESAKVVVPNVERAEETPKGIEEPGGNALALWYALLSSAILRRY